MNKVNGYYTTVGYEWKVFLHKAPALDESDWGDIHPCTIMADNIFDGMMLYTNQADIESDDIVWYGTSAQACLLIDGLIERGIFSDNWAEFVNSSLIVPYPDFIDAVACSFPPAI